MRVNFLQRKRLLKNTVNNPTAIKTMTEENHDKNGDGLDDRFVYEGGELTPFECVADAKKRDLDMTEIDRKIHELPGKTFVPWYIETYGTPKS